MLLLPCLGSCIVFYDCQGGGVLLEVHSQLLDLNNELID